MRNSLIIAVTAALFVGCAEPRAATVFTPSPDAIRAHMTYLASDALAGREGGTPGYDLAAAYVVDQFAKIGLQPGGQGGFLQPVTLIQHRALPGGRFRLIRDGESLDLEEGADFRSVDVPHGRDITVQGALVFAGHGVVTADRDDFAGLNLRGKIAVVLEGAGDGVEASDFPFVSTYRAKAQMAQQRGAVGLIVVRNAPFRRSARAEPPDFAWTWATPDGNAGFAGAPVLAELSRDGAAKLFEGARQDYEAIRDADYARKSLKGFDLPGQAEVFAPGELGESRASANVIGIVPGSDSRLKDQYVVMSGHLDHLGVRDGPDADRIYNGAFDNAGGISILLETARGLAQGERPKRSVIFVAFTGEELGLIGSDYFVRHAPAGSIVADLNLDMPIFSTDFTDFTALGAGHSTLARPIAQAADQIGVAMSPDPIPRLQLFTRSDQFRFVEAGVPAVALFGGFKGGGEAAFFDFYDNRYHRPNDDMSQPIDFDAAGKWARLSLAIIEQVANQGARPAWNRNDLFGDRFGDQP